jgi:hypothetical protein
MTRANTIFPVHCATIASVILLICTTYPSFSFI